MENQIQIDGLTLNYTDTGCPDGHPVIVMHGWGCNLSTVQSISAILEPGMRVLSLDLPGHGKSQEPPAIWGVEEYTRLVEKFIALLKLKRVSLIGHSFGGRISILLSSRQEYIDKVVLVDAAGVKPRRKFSYYIKVYSYKILKHLLPLMLGKQKGGDVLESYRRRRGSADYGNASPMMRGILSKCVNEDLTSVMQSIRASVLLIWGKEDSATPLSDAHIMEKLIPDAGLVAFDGCGHYSFLDNPFGFRNVLVSFFKAELSQRK